MVNKIKNDARLSVRLPAELKALIEKAATLLGQSVNAFAVSILARHAHSILEQHNITRLSRRDRDLFVALLENADAKPNKALLEAARRYKEHMG